MFFRKSSFAFFLCFLWSLLASKYGPRNYVRLPKDMIDSQKPASSELRHRFFEVALEMLEYWKQMDGDLYDEFQEVPLNLLVLHETSWKLEVLPIDIYAYVESCIRRSLRILLPDDKVTNTSKFSHLKKVHFSTLYDVAQKTSRDIRPSAIKIILYHRSCLDERVQDGRISVQFYKILLGLLEIQYQCLEESFDLRLSSDRYLNITKYVDLTLKILEYRLEGDIPFRIREILMEFGHDLKTLSKFELDSGCPDDISENAIIKFASMQILKESYTLAHHEICKMARLLLFQEPIEDVVPGKYLELKKKFPFEGIADTFTDYYEDLGSCLSGIRDEQYLILNMAEEIWEDSMPFIPKLSIIQLYTAASFSYDILEQAEGEIGDSIEEGDDISNDTLSRVYQALFIHVTGIAFVARCLLLPNVVAFFDPFLKFPDEFDYDFEKKFTFFLNLYENNFRVVRDLNPGVVDLVFKTIELCRELARSLTKELQVGDEITNYDCSCKWDIGVQLFIFNEYVFKPMHNLGYLKGFSDIAEVIQDAITGLVSVFEESKIHDRLNGMLMNCLVENCVWHIDDKEWKEVLAQIPSQYKAGSSLKRRYTLDATIKRWAARTQEQNVQEEVPKQNQPSLEALLHQVGLSRVAPTVTPSSKPSKNKGKKAKKNKRKKKSPKESKHSDSSSDSDVDKKKETASEIDAKTPENIAKGVLEVKSAQTDKEPEIIVEVQVGSKSQAEANEVVYDAEEPIVPLKMPSPPSSPSKLKTTKPTLWNNASTVLFPSLTTTSAEQEIFEETDEEQMAEMPPSHFTNLIEVIGYGYVKADPRDIAMGLLLVGQRVWVKHIQPLIVSLEENGLGQLVQVLMNSSEKFEMELAMLKVTEPELYLTLLNPPMSLIPTTCQPV